MKQHNDHEAELSVVRETVGKYISGKRYSHTLAVEEEIVSLCKIFNLPPKQTFDLRVAALLHDITKERSPEEHAMICEENNIRYGNAEIVSPKVFHAITAPAIIKKDLNKYYRPGIISPIRWHTTGRKNMTLGEKLLYLADYIEPTRKFPDCIRLREYFYNQGTRGDLRHLNDTLILSFDMTIRNLLDEGAQIHPQTVLSLNSLLKEKQEI